MTAYIRFSNVKMLSIDAVKSLQWALSIEWWVERQNGLNEAIEHIQNWMVVVKGQDENFSSATCLNMVLDHMFCHSLCDPSWDHTHCDFFFSHISKYSNTLQICYLYSHE
jgi:hypothetical protein